MNYRAPIRNVTSLRWQKMYQQPLLSHTMNWPCTCLQVLWKMMCHMSCVSRMSHVCHTSQAVRVFNGLYHKNYHHQYFLSSGAVTPQTTPEAVTNWSVLFRWVLSITAPKGYSTCSKTLAGDKPQIPWAFCCTTTISSRPKHSDYSKAAY